MYMKKFVCAVLLMFACATVLIASDLKTYKATYEKEMDSIVLTHGMEIGQLDLSYAEALDSLLARVKKAGDLDRSVAAMDEIKRFSDERAMPSKASSAPAIQNLQAAYKQQASVLDATKARKIVFMTTKYDKALEALQKSLVSSDRFDDAKAVQAERKAATTSDSYAKAEKTMLALGQKPVGRPKADKPTIALPTIWISKDAKYTASSVHSKYAPLPSLLTGEGKLYATSRKDKFAFHTAKQADPSITIDLGRTKTIERIHIKNRKGQTKRSKGITAWVSNSSVGKGEQVGTSDKSLDEYTMTLSKPRKARFITIGLRRKDYFHLEHVKIFGQDK
jgi:hypothetical protein